MFGSSKPVVIDRYGSRRSRRVPRWLLLLLFGIAVGAGGVVWLQERYLPPRLSAAETDQLRQSYAQADSERTRLRADLAETSKRLETALAESKSAATELAASRQTVEGLRESLSFAAESLPPDPRGGTVEVRAGRFAFADGKLAYDVLLYRERAGNKPLAAVLQFVLSPASRAAPRRRSRPSRCRCRSAATRASAAASRCRRVSARARPRSTCWTARRARRWACASCT